MFYLQLSIHDGRRVLRISVLKPATLEGTQSYSVMESPRLNCESGLKTNYELISDEDVANGIQVEHTT